MGNRFGDMVRVRVTRRRVLLVSVTVLVMLFLFGGAVFAWEYTSTPKFCGTTCHTMPVEYTAYQRSAHARVDCVNCHLAKGATSAIPQKASDIRHVIRQLSSSYELPIVTTTLRPAREVCERCHWPEKFYGDKIREIKHYAPDQANSETRTYLIMKTGGGTTRQGLGLGIHWHVQAQVEYVTTDEMKQDIPWVRATFADGRVVEYVTADEPISSTDLAKSEIRRMDCIDCHNRASHLIRSPQRSVDELLGNGGIDKGIPFIKSKSVEVLSTKYANQEEAISAISALDNYYQVSYPQVYNQRQESIKTAIQAIKDVYTLTNFPEREANWQTYPNNTGHLEFQGCFRCHDGRHIATDKTVPAERLSIRLQCNVCHSIPSTVSEGERPPALPVGTVQEPASHVRGDWMAQHPSQVGQQCTACHGELKYNAKPTVKDQSFCSNVACHGTGWAKYVKLIAVPTTPSGPAPAAEPTPAAGAAPTPAPAPAGIPEIPHTLDGRQDCLLCHNIGGMKPMPANHQGRTVDTCITCHQLKK